jgi:hypothetical protein
MLYSKIDADIAKKPFTLSKTEEPKKPHSTIPTALINIPKPIIKTIAESVWHTSCIMLITRLNRAALISSSVGSLHNTSMFLFIPFPDL